MGEGSAGVAALLPACGMNSGVWWGRREMALPLLIGLGQPSQIELEMEKKVCKVQGGEGWV